MRAGSLVLAVAPLVWLGCQDTIDPGPMLSLERSGQVSLLCREHGTGTGRDLRACPDPDDLFNDGEDRRVLALVTQTLRGEVAVVDLHAQKVVDVDPSIPGIEFLPVGANPTAIVSTPGGTATFVATAEPGREALFALPTTCITAPRAGEPARELTLFSACRLPAAAGQLAIVTDVAVASGDSVSRYRTSCSTDSPWAASAELSFAERRDDCPANLEEEEHIAPLGRRKVLVTLPDLGKIAVYDAQALLNQPPGSFANCVPETVVALSTEAPLAEEVTQSIPSDLMPAEGCLAPPHRYAFGPVPSQVSSRPAGIALAGERLFVADLGVPVIHELDLSDPCAIVERAPLVPLAFDEPNRRVMTRDLAVSGPLKSQSQFLYAVDDADGSAMVFDVGEESVERTPLIRPNSPFFPFEPPDRIRLDSPIRDLGIITRDAPLVDPSTQTVREGVLCDPNPEAKAPGSLYRTASDYSEGAGPRKLRGTFAMLGLASGQIVAVDIEDWDAACRRPLTNNPNSDGVDWRGCAHDPSFDGLRFRDKNGDPTVSEEMSCNVVQPHRVRSGSFFLTSSDRGAYAPALSYFPRLSSPSTGDLPSGQSESGRKHPKLLAVPFASEGQRSTPEELFVGTTRYTLDEDADNPLSIAPEEAEVGSLFFPVIEPRLYSANENFTATYEGKVVDYRPTGQLPLLVDEAALGLPRALLPGELVLRDPDAFFCDQGVEDSAVAEETASAFGVGGPDYAERYSDYVLLEDDFDEDEPYFQSAAAAEACGTDDLKESCEDWFGTAAAPRPAREFRIKEAYHGLLIIEPRSARDPEELLERVRCCFPSVHGYTVRASRQWVVRGARMLHDIVPGEGLRCVRDCSPRRNRLRGRAFEISSEAAQCAPSEAVSGSEVSTCAIGPRVDGDVCVVAQADGAVDPAALGVSLPERCVYSSLKGRFAVYRGLRPSVRDMTFSWTVSGGFFPLSAGLANSTAGQSVLLEHMLFSEQLDALVTVDSASGGLGVVGLETFTLRGEPYQ